MSRNVRSQDFNIERDIPQHLALGASCPCPACHWIDHIWYNVVTEKLFSGSNATGAHAARKALAAYAIDAVAVGRKFWREMSEALPDTPPIHWMSEMKTIMALLMTTTGALAEVPDCYALRLAWERLHADCPVIPNEEKKARALQRAYDFRTCCGSIDVSKDPYVTGIKEDPINLLDAHRK
jgi:hypothetical protein